MKNANSARSDKIVKNFLARKPHCKRKVQVFEKAFNASPSTVFDQLCPSRETDWINGWDVDLLYTKTGYAEPLCLFRTTVSNIFGSGLWMITRLEPSTILELVVFQEDSDIVEYTKIHIIDNGNGTCKGVWEITLTATSEKGNSLIDSVPDDEPAFLAELEYFLNMAMTSLQWRQA